MINKDNNNNTCDRDAVASQPRAKNTVLDICISKLQISKKDFEEISSRGYKWARDCADHITIARLNEYLKGRVAIEFTKDGTTFCKQKSECDFVQLVTGTEDQHTAESIFGPDYKLYKNDMRYTLLFLRGVFSFYNAIEDQAEDGC